MMQRLAKFLNRSLMASIFWSEYCPFTDRVRYSLQKIDASKVLFKNLAGLCIIFWHLSVFALIWLLRIPVFPSMACIFEFIACYKRFARDAFVHHLQKSKFRLQAGSARKTFREGKIFYLIGNFREIESSEAMPMPACRVALHYEHWSLTKGVAMKKFPRGRG